MAQNLFNIGDEVIVRIYDSSIIDNFSKIWKTINNLEEIDKLSGVIKIKGIVIGYWLCNNSDSFYPEGGLPYLIKINKSKEMGLKSSTANAYLCSTENSIGDDRLNSYQILEKYKNEMVQKVSERFIQARFHCDVCDVCDA